MSPRQPTFLYLPMRAWQFLDAIRNIKLAAPTLAARRRDVYLRRTRLTPHTNRAEYGDGAARELRRWWA